MQHNHPKFEIGEKVFFLSDNQIKEKIVLGIFACFSHEPSYSEKKTPAFEKNVYYFDIKTQPRDYSWISEEKIFSTKEELIGFLFKNK